jgi:glycine betaine/proline transport system permease protein
VNLVLHRIKDISRNGWAVWALALFIAWLFSQLSGDLLPWAHKYPRDWIWPIRYEITAFMKWLINDATFGLFTFKELTRSLS